MLTNFDMATLYKFITSDKIDKLDLSISAFLALKTNLERIKGVYKALGETEQKYLMPSEELEEYNKEKQELIKTYKDNDVVNEVTKEDALKLLIENNKEVLEKRVEAQKEWVEVLNSDSSVELKMIKHSDIDWSETKLKAQDFNALFIMIEDEEE